MGSVKDLEVIENPTPSSIGHGVFYFSDRYSVFDWGRMPVEIDRKGEILALMGAYTFEIMEKGGIKTHYRGMEEDGETKKIDDLEGPSKMMHVDLVNVLKPDFKGDRYDYSVFVEPPVNNYLVPLEIIYRNRIPIGSSARGRYSPKDLNLNLSAWPEEAVSLKEPLIEPSTKLEEQDVYLDKSEAEEITGNVSIQEIYDLTKRVNTIITSRAEKAEMTNDDGKLEFLYIGGDIVLGDVAGTFDENRFTFEGFQVSKEVLRQAYKKHQPEWVEEVKEAKKKAREEGIKDWKKLVSSKPSPLGIEDLVSEMYQAGANRYIGKEFFDVRDLSEVIGDIKSSI